MSNYTGDYHYSSDPFSFGATRTGVDNIRRERDEEKIEKLKKELTKYTEKK